MNPPTSNPSPSGKTIASKVFGSGRATLLSLIIGVFGAAWILLHSPRAAQVLAPTALPAAGLTSDILRMGREGHGKWERLEGERLRRPLYKANLACRVGDYIVSVRRVNSDRYAFDSNPAYGEALVSPEPLHLGLQVMAVRTGRLQRIDHINTKMKVIDSAGNTLKLLEAGQEFAFQDGVGCVYQLSAPATNAEYLRSIDGVIQLVPDDALSAAGSPAREEPSPAMPSPANKMGQTLPFHIENVPLPWKLHVFGLMGAAILDVNKVRMTHLTSGMGSDRKPVMIQGAQMEEVLKCLPQSAFQSTMRPPQPNLLTLVHNVPNTVTLTLPEPGRVTGIVYPPASALTLTCVLTPQVRSDGRMQIAVKMQSAKGVSLETGITVWDNEPALLSVPAAQLYPDQEKGSMLVLYLDLHLDWIPPESMFNGSTPKEWLAKKGEIGGALSGSIITSKGAFGLGRAKLTIRRLNQEATPQNRQKGKQATIVVALDKRGVFNLSNLAVGRYQVEPAEIIPYQSAAVKQCSFAEFLSKRSAIQQAKQNIGMQEAVVKAGDRVELEPWVYGEGR